MRKLHVLMEMMLPYYNPMGRHHGGPISRFFCDCANALYRENFISIEEMNLTHKYIKQLINNEWSLTDILFGDKPPNECTQEQQIQMVMFWINEIEILKEKNL